MRKVLFITRSLDIDSMSDNIFDTSSKIFEYGLVKSIATQCDLHIIHLGSSKKERVTVKNLSFSSINYNSPCGAIRLLMAICSETKSNKASILTTGYYPTLSSVLLLSRAIGFKTFSYVYDTHTLATERMPKIKRKILNAYFNIGFFLAKKMTGLLVVNDLFISKLGIVTPYMKTQVGVQLPPEKKESKSKESSSRTVILFAGTINFDNGADLIVEFLKGNKTTGFEFHFYGSGDSLHAIVDYMKSDDRIKYFGRIPEALLNERIESANFLINLRNPKSLSCLYAFPSKLVNFMATGTPVISNKFPGLDDHYVKYLIPVNNFTAESIAETLSLLKNESHQNKSTTTARDFIKKNNSWENISKDVIKFISSF